MNGGMRMKALAFAVLVMLPWVAAAETFQCKPLVKYECAAEQCERVTQDFQHAESFGFDRKTRRLSACLWTSCYQGKATLLKGKAAGALTAVGKLEPDAPGGTEPLVFSLTIDSGNQFTAVWGYAGKSLTFDMGACEVSK